MEVLHRIRSKLRKAFSLGRRRRSAKVTSPPEPFSERQRKERSAHQRGSRTSHRRRLPHGRPQGRRPGRRNRRRSAEEQWSQAKARRRPPPTGRSREIAFG